MPSPGRLPFSQRCTSPVLPPCHAPSGRPPPYNAATVRAVLPPCRAPSGRPPPYNAATARSCHRAVPPLVAPLRYRAALGTRLSRSHRGTRLAALGTRLGRFRSVQGWLPWVQGLVASLLGCKAWSPLVYKAALTNPERLPTSMASSDMAALVGSSTNNPDRVTARCLAHVVAHRGVCQCAGDDRAARGRGSRSSSRSRPLAAAALRQRTRFAASHSPSAVRFGIFLSARALGCGLRACGRQRCVHVEGPSYARGPARAPATKATRSAMLLSTTARPPPALAATATALPLRLRAPVASAPLDRPRSSRRSRSLGSSRNLAAMGHADKESVPDGYVVPEVWEMKDMGGTFGGTNRPTAGARYEKELPVSPVPPHGAKVQRPGRLSVAVSLCTRSPFGRRICEEPGHGDAYNGIAIGCRSTASIDPGAAPQMERERAQALACNHMTRAGTRPERDRRWPSHPSCPSWLFRNQVDADGAHSSHCSQ
eukprot:364256-Chlamydomonas_euryale.AAC.6